MVKSMIIEYEDCYKNDVKRLLVELHEYIVSIDKEKYNIMTPEYGDMCLDKTFMEVDKCNGKILLYKDEDNIVGMIIGIINNDVVDTYDFKSPRRGRITEFVVSKEYRKNGIGKKLFLRMEEHLKSLGCESVLIGVFGYNDNAINFYTMQGYNNRVIDMVKVFN